MSHLLDERDALTFERRMFWSMLASLMGTVVVGGCAPTTTPDEITLPADRQRLETFVPAQEAQRAAELPPAPPEAPLGVVEFGPRGATSGGGQVRVRFNKPVVPLHGLDDAPVVGDWFRFKPALKGKARWLDPQVLVFEVDEAPPQATRVHVTFQGPIEATDGTRWTQTLDWEFTTERPRVSDTSPPHQTRDHTADTPVLVWMTHPVDLDAVQEALEVKSRPTGRDDAPWDNRAFRLRRLNAQERKRRSYGNDPEPDALSFVVEPAGRWPLHHTIQLAMKPTLVGRLGPLPMGQPWTMQFETYAPLHTEVECVDKGCRPMPIEVTFNNPVLIGQERYVTLTPKPKSFRIESLGGWEDERTTTTLVMYGAFEPDIPYTVTIAGAIRDTYGQRLGQKHTAQVIFDPPPSTLNLSDTSGVLAPGRARTIGVAARRVAQIRVRVAVLNDAQILQLHAGHKGITMGQYPQPFLSIDALGATSTSHTLDLTPSKPTDWSSTALDLEALSGISEGVVLIEVEPTAMTPGGWARPSTKQGVYWLSDIGGWVQVSAVSSVVRLARLSNGDPISGAEVAMWWGQLGAASSAAPKDKRNTVWWGTLPKGPAVVGTTDDQGLLRLPSASDWPRVSNTGMLWVNKGNARALVPLGTSVYGAVEPQPNLTALKASERIQASVITERGVYRPGEPVHVVGWSAVDTPWTASGLRDMPLGVPVTLTLIDPDGNEVATHNTETGPHGKIGATLPIPDDGALGRYRVHADFAQGTYHTNRILKVEDYRTPEFEVQAAASRHAIIWGESNTIRATGNYTFGGPVEIIHINHATRCSRTEPHLPELEASWHVGTPRGGGYGVGYPLKSSTPSTSQPGQAVLEVSGAGIQRMTSHCTTSVSLRDPSFQEVGTSASFMVHPARLYAAVHLPESPTEGQPATVSVRAVTHTGARAEAPQKAKVVVTWEDSVPVYVTRGKRRFIERWEERKEQVKVCQLQLHATGPDAQCKLPPLRSGHHRVQVLLTVDGNATETVDTFWSMPSSWTPWAHSDEPEALEIKVQPTDAKPGDTVQVMIRSKWSDLSGQLFLLRGGIREVHPFTLTQQQATLHFTVTDAWVPNLMFRAVLAVPIAKSKEPEVFQDNATVMVSHAHRQLDAKLSLASQAAPGDEVPVTVSVRDTHGKPISTGGRAALWAVDEAVLSLTDYTVPDLLAELMIERHAETQGLDMYPQVLAPYVVQHLDPYTTGAMGLFGRGYGAGGMGTRAFGMAGAIGGPPAAREQFLTTPLFLADLPLDAKGQAQTTLTLPDNLTTFKVIAVASAPLADGSAMGRIGTTEASVQVSAPLMVRSALPRMARPGDAFQLAAIVNNGFGPSGRLEVSVVLHDEQGTLALLSEPTLTKPLAASAQTRVSFSAKAQTTGTPRVELRARLTPDDPSLAPAEDAVIVELPVERERTRLEHAAIYGDLNSDRPVAIPVQLPTPVVADMGGLEVSTSSSLLGGLQDAVEALIQYPYGCVEQTSSRMVPLVALSELGNTWPIAVGDTKTFVQDGIERLWSMQQANGGFGYWPGSREAHPYGSAYATWVLQMANQAGHNVNPARLKQALDYLEQTTEEPDRDMPDGVLYMADVRRAIAVHTLAQAGRRPIKAVESLLAPRLPLPLFSRAFVAAALHRINPADRRLPALTDALIADVVELPGSAHVTERLPYNLGGYFHSDGRSDAIVLMALLAIQPNHPLVAKLARGLLERRRNGMWRNTQENAYALVALARFGRIYEREEPNFTARAWAGDQPLLQTAFQGRQFTTEVGHLPQKKVLTQLGRSETHSGLLPVTLHRQGQGRMYYRIGLEYAIEGPITEPRSSHMSFSRVLRTTQGPLSTDGSVDAGSVMALDMAITIPQRMRYVAIDIPLPAGLEPIQTDLQKGPLPVSGPRGWWVSHEELRRDRVMVFADDLGPGEHHHTVYVRATTPGRFQMPSAMAQNMYMPEVFARTPDATVTVRF